MDWPTTKYRLNAKAFAPRFPGTDHELLEAGTEIVSNLKPGPHMDALTPEGEEAKRRAGHQELDFTRHQPLAVGDEDDQLAARVAKATAVALAQMGVVPGGAATQPETVALAEENAALKARLGPDVAGVMITNPNTCGLFERDLKEISDAVHAVGGYVYCDGANFNAIVGRVRPGDLGVDAMHINLHKTFSTPHGGGGPGSGPVVLSEALSPFGPLPYTARTADGVVHLIEEADADAFERTHFGGPLNSFGRMVAFHGQMGMFTRALTYILSHGADGLRQVAEDAVLNANYVLRSLEDVLDAPFAHSGPCMHEALFSDNGMAEGFTTLDIAKGLIDEGFHPMTVYFPLVVHGAMLVEPTETESKAALDQFIGALRSVAGRAKAGDPSLKSAPHYAPRARLDETLAARKPVLVWKDAPLAEAAE